MKENLKWIVTSEGFNFQIESENKIYSLNNLTELIKTVSDDNIAALQILSQLVDENKAINKKDTITVPHHIIAQLNEEERYALNLPEPFPFYIEIRAKGNLSDSNFHYIYYFLNGKTQPFINPKRIGSYLEISTDQVYLLTGELYYLLEVIDKFNSEGKNQKDILLLNSRF